MEEIPPLLRAALTGFVSGFLLCIPVGPVNLTIMNEAAQRGFRRAVMIGLGATAMEAIYCFFAFTGFASFFERGMIKAAMELCSFIFMLVLGIRFLTAKTVNASLHISDKADAIEERIEKRFHPRSGFMTGFVQVMANLGVLAVWIVFAANFIAREWVEPDWPGKLSCVAGVTLSIGGWFTALSWFCAKGHRNLSPRALLRLQHISGLILLAIAVGHGAHIIWRMGHPKV